VSPASFTPEHARLTSHVPGLRFEMRHDGDDFMQTAIHATRDGEDRSTAHIAFAYGAGPADEIYFAWRDDLLYELPTAWLHPLNCWGTTALSHGQPDFARETMPRCLECHNTWFSHTPGTLNQ